MLRIALTLLGVIATGLALTLIARYLPIIPTLGSLSPHKMFVGYGIAAVGLVGLLTLLATWHRTARAESIRETRSTKDAFPAPVGLEEPVPAPIQRPYGIMTSSAFAVEAFTSAGPRKSSAEYEDETHAPHDLCEDAAGVMAMAGAYLWWLSDGTSNGSYLPSIGSHGGVSTRMFARDLGDAFVTAHLATGRTIASADNSVQTVMFATLKNAWQTRLQDYLNQVIQAGAWDAFAAGAPVNTAGALVFKWSATFMGGLVRFSETGADMDLFQSGDSGALVLTQVDGLEDAHVVSPTKDRIILRATIWNGALEVDVFAGEHGTMPVQSISGVCDFFAMSDGLTKGDLAVYLPNLREATRTRSAAELRAGLLQRRDKSYDDKTLVIGRLLVDR